jgi:tRNA (guanine-N7-)-methyltransferase
LLAKLKDDQLDNIKISQLDIRILLAKIADLFFDEIYILFPDPWPKQKHYKRRLIDLEFLEILAKKIKSDGKLIIATDHDAYKTWILSAILKSNSFELLIKNKNDWLDFPTDWTITKYQKKAMAEGREAVIFNLKKCQN